jgi:hypothetical protein
MATGNDELVRSSLDAFLRGDWDALSQLMDPGAEWLWYGPGDWDCHDRTKLLATLFERQREGVVTGLNAVVAVDERSSWRSPGRGLSSGAAGRTGMHGRHRARRADRAQAGLPQPRRRAQRRRSPTRAADRHQARGRAGRRPAPRLRPRRAVGPRRPTRSAPATPRRCSSSCARTPHWPTPGSVAPSAGSRGRCCTSSPTGPGRCRMPRPRFGRWSPRAPTSTRASPGRTPRRRCTSNYHARELGLYEARRPRKRWRSAWLCACCGSAHAYIGARGAAQEVIGAVAAAAHSLSG